MRLKQALSLSVVAAVAGAIPAPRDLRLEYMPSPVLGNTEPLPRFAWTVNCTGCPRGLSQTAYNLVVVDVDSGATVWHQTANSSRSNHIVYAGPSLKAGGAYSWHVGWTGSDGSVRWDQHYSSLITHHSPLTD
jgi:hypothetical protein